MEYVSIIIITVIIITILFIYYATCAAANKVKYPYKAKITKNH